MVKARGCRLDNKDLQSVNTKQGSLKQVAIFGDEDDSLSNEVYD